MYKHVGAIFLALMLMVAALSVNALAVGEDTLEDSTDTVVAIIPVLGEDDLTYSTLEAAIADAQSGDVIILTTDYTLAESVVIPTGVQLTIPTSASYNDTTAGNNVSGAVSNGSAYVTLTVPTGKTLTVNGTLLVAGNQQSSTKKASCLTGNYGKVAVDGSLVVNGELYARGEISGTGEVTANSGSTVYQMFQISDWRGGNAAMGAYNTNKVFPFNLYELKNITANTTYYNGSTLKGQYFIVASGTGVPGSEVVVGTNGQMEFEDSSRTGDNVQFSFNAGISTVTVNGRVKTGGITVDMSVYGFPYTITSNNIVCPFGYNMDVVIANGGSLSISNQMKFLPGCNITVKNGGTLTIKEGGEAYFYGASGYSTTYNWANWGPTTAATLTVEEGGTVNNSGTIASTDATFANVDGFTATETTVTVKEVTQANTSVTLVSVPFTVGTNAASAAEVEEIVEEPVEEIVEISEELVEVEETFIAE